MSPVEHRPPPRYQLDRSGLAWREPIGCSEPGPMTRPHIKMCKQIGKAGLTQQSSWTPDNPFRIIFLVVLGNKLCYLVVIYHAHCHTPFWPTITSYLAYNRQIWCKSVKYHTSWIRNTPPLYISLAKCLWRLEGLGVTMWLPMSGFSFTKAGPLLYWQVFLCTGEGCTDNGTNVLHYYHIALAFLTAFLFATHLPERLAPGSFDYIGKTEL